MEVLGVTAVIGAFGATALWLAVTRGNALRERDQALWKAAGLADERDIAARKLRAMSTTIIALERLVVEGGGDARSLVGVLGHHRRMLSDAEALDDPAEDDVRPDPSPADDPDREPGVRPGSEVLVDPGGDVDSPVRPASGDVDVRSLRMRGDD